MTQNCSCHGSGGHLSQTVVATLKRPRYSPGLILEDSDLTAAVEYTRDLNRMLFRHLFGCGVICGLTVSAHKKCGGITITVAPGLALDGCGDPVEVPKKVEIAVDEKTTEGWEEKGNRLWVVLCGKEKLCAPRSLVCDADEFDGVAQHTRIQSMAEVTVTPVKPECVCGRSLADEQEEPATGQNSAPGAGAPPRGDADADPYQTEREDRDECAADCGCGTACDCGCCILLAELSFDGVADWDERHDGVRVLVRPKMARDHEPQKTSAANAAYAASVATGYRDTQTGALMTQREVMARVGQHLAKSGGTLERIELAEVGLAPARAVSETVAASGPAAAVPEKAAPAAAAEAASEQAVAAPEKARPAAAAGTKKGKGATPAAAARATK